MNYKLLLILSLFPIALFSCQKESPTKSTGENYLEIKSKIGKREYFSQTINCPDDCIGDLEKVSLEPVPDMTPCTMIYGGPEEILLRGEIGGERVVSQFNRSGGCEIDRFDSVALFLEKQGIAQKELFPPAPRLPKIKEGSLP